MNPHEDADDLWRARNGRIAALIPPGASVLDLGAGAQALRELLSRGCRYTPADVAPRNGALPFDMNDDVYPEGVWDVAVLSGVLEYADDPAAVLGRVRDLAPVLLLSYAHGGSLDYRTRQQWCNHLSRAGLEVLLGVYEEYRIVRQWNSHTIYRARR